MKKGILVLLISLVFLSCTTTYKDISIFGNSDELNGKEWYIGFKYDMAKSEKNNESVIVSAAQLQLLDDIYYNLKSQGINISTSNKNLENKILIHTVYEILYGQFRTIDILLLDSNDEIARVKLTNGDGRAFNPGRDNSKIADYAAEQIIEIFK